MTVGRQVGAGADVLLVSRLDSPYVFVVLVGPLVVPPGPSGEEHLPLGAPFDRRAARGGRTPYRDRNHPVGWSVGSLPLECPR